MAINYNPTTVSDGLVLALDAANARSYPGSGTAWTDISYRGNNGTLTNGPTFVAPPYNEPFGGAGGVYFDGSGDYLAVPDNSAFLFTGDFTVEAWVYQTSSKTVTVLGQWGTAGNTSFVWRLESTGKLGFAYKLSGGSELNATASTSTVSLNTWTHIAWVRSGTTIYYYINGVQDATTNTVSGSFNNSSADVNVGLYNTLADTYFNGYISNLRILKGTALYTSNFTPPRVLLSNIPNTSLLTCQGGTIRDASSNNFTITPNGDASAVSYAPYIKFDGTNDYINCGTGLALSGSWTISAFVRTSVSSAAQFILGRTGDVSTSFAQNYNIFIQNNNKFRCQTSADSYKFAESTTTVVTNTWYYVTGLYNSSTKILSIYVNGNLEGSSTALVGNPPTTGTQYVTLGAGDGLAVANRLTGNIAQALIYNRALTAEEVLQNYNALKGRFGL